jgi:acetyl-CoA acyltransferase
MATGGAAVRDVYVVGVGMTPFGRFLDRPLRSLAEAAVDLALKDAGTTHAAIEAIVFANAAQDAMEGQYGIRGQAALSALPFDAVPIINVENACASASTALHVALLQIRSGSAEVALALGAEKLASADTALSMTAFEGSWDRVNKDASLARLAAMGKAMPTPPHEAARESSRSVFMDVYSALAKYHMARFGTTQRHLASVAAKNHRHSVGNPLSQYRKAFTVEEVLAARLIAWPLTLPMCSPISDGAAAAVVCSAQALGRFERRRAIRVRACVLMSGGRREADEIERQISLRAARKAYDAAGLGPDDIDVVECHDATAFGEIQQSENLGFFGFGDGGPLAERGVTTVGGKIPFNPSGGLESKGHPIGATGLGQIHELVTQLRGEAGVRQVEGARIALQENGGGLIGIEEAAVAVTILEKAS